jgi:hypothetical protein
MPYPRNRPPAHGYTGYNESKAARPAAVLAPPRRPTESLTAGRAFRPIRAAIARRAHPGSGEKEELQIGKVLIEGRGAEARSDEQ